MSLPITSQPPSTGPGASCGAGGFRSPLAQQGLLSPSLLSWGSRGSGESRVGSVSGLPWSTLCTECPPCVPGVWVLETALPFLPHAQTLSPATGPTRRCWQNRSVPGPEGRCPLEGEGHTPCLPVGTGRSCETPPLTPSLASSPVRNPAQSHRRDALRGPGGLGITY